MSSAEWVKTEWYPAALQRAKQGYMSCGVNTGDPWDLGQELYRQGMTSCYAWEIFGDVEVHKASWNKATKGMGLVLYNTSRRVRDPLKKELQDKLQAIEQKCGGTIHFESVNVTLSGHYSTSLVRSVLQDTYLHVAVGKLRNDGVPSYNIRFYCPRQQRRTWRIRNRR